MTELEMLRKRVEELERKLSVKGEPQPNQDFKLKDSYNNDIVIYLDNEDHEEDCVISISYHDEGRHFSLDTLNSYIEMLIKFKELME